MSSYATNPALRGYWHAVAATSDVLTGPISITLLGEGFVVWRGGDGRIAAAADRCPHRESPLSTGEIVDGCLQCPYHGWRYDTDGKCVLVPSSGPGSPIPPRAVLASVHAAERYGLVWICPGEPVAGIPEIAEELDPVYRRINTEVEQWDASTTRMVDNFLDVSHFPYVHRASFGGATDPEVAKVELEPLGDWYGYQYSVVAANPAEGSGASGQATATVSRSMSTSFVLPFAVRSTIEYETGLRHILLLLSTPIDDERSYFTFVVWRNDDFSVHPEDVIRLDRKIGQEDHRMLEQLSGPLPLDNTTLVNVQADKASVEWKRRLRAVLEGG
jgi:phenylpropionate dioxygenase-like ring-hydroxylating dioxygenase large terminal subunit